MDASKIRRILAEWRVAGRTRGDIEAIKQIDSVGLHWILALDRVGKSADEIAALLPRMRREVRPPYGRNGDLWIAANCTVQK